MVDLKPDKADFTILSSVKRDIWGGIKNSGAYEWWYFDALSDDASEAIVVIFFDNFVFSPRYNRKCHSSNGETASADTPLIPAVAFVYYAKGRPVYRSICEFGQSEMTPQIGLPGVKIGHSSFEYRKAAYGSGYLVKVDLPLPRGKRLRGAFEWLLIENDLAIDHAGNGTGHVWNVVAPRSDVTGRITIVDKKGRRKKIKFRGTGYHDHNSDNRWMPDTIENWFWGRAHFPFATAVYYRYKEKTSDQEVSKLILVRDGDVQIFEPEAFSYQKTARDWYGIRYPLAQHIRAEGIELIIDEPTVIDSSFFYLRFLSRMTLRNEGIENETIGITEYLCPATLSNRWLDHLTSLRIGKGGKSAFLP